MLKTFLFKYSLRQCYIQLAVLQTDLFAAYVKSDFLSKKEHYLKNYYKNRSIFFKKLSCTRQWLSYLPKYTSCLLQLETLYEIIFSLHLLRFRIADYSVFEIPRSELSELQNQIATSLKALGKAVLTNNYVGDAALFLESIQTLETLYQHTLKILLPNPLPFWFFIQDLYHLNHALQMAAYSLCPKLLLPHIN
jgi:hypothetical protein